MDVFVARQPILDKNKKTIAYELLFRDGLENSFPDLDGDTATVRLLSNTFFALGIEEIMGKCPVFINFTQNIIQKKVPLFFPEEKVVIEVLEEVTPTPDVLAALSAFKKKGFRIALDDFVYRKELRPLVQYADIIKFDFRLSSQEEIAVMILDLKEKPGIKFLGEKIETHEEFDQAVAMGCSLFQGYFFEKPRVLSNRSIPPAKMNLLRLLSEVSQAETDFIKVTRMIRDDVSIAFKLLKFINSAYYQRPYEVDSVKDAVALLGEKDIRQFITLIAATGLSKGKPEAMIKSSMIAGCMCESVGQAIGSQFSGEELFTLGLFTKIDAILEMPMAQILKVLPFSEKICRALEGGDSAYTYLFNVVKGFEKGEWERVSQCCNRFSIDESRFLTYYARAVQMADAFLEPG
ncbi:MAG: HDOD domain-containing protein [Desulfobacterium sp.]|nr:HDOD domain-containing protein [Desulfobacterium sp.]